MDNRYMLMILAALTAGTVITRFLPFLLFPQGRKMPRYVEYLGGTLPYATMGLLVVYCLKGVDIRLPLGFRRFCPAQLWRCSMC